MTETAIPATNDQGQTTSFCDRGIAIVDCMTAVSPNGHNIAHIPRQAFRDEQSLEAYPSGTIVGYLFKGATAERFESATDIAGVVRSLDTWNIEFAGVTLNTDEAPQVIDQLQAHGDRWVFSIRVNPHEGMKEVRALDELVRRYPRVHSACFAPHATYPTIPPNSKEYYPLYAKCVELEIPAFVYVGIPGPRVPGWTQDPMHLDEVCWFFPELTLIMKHGGEPWADLCVKLMLKWPNLYYSTSGFAPKYYPKEIIDYANTRGSDKIIYSGYWPIMSFEDLFNQIDNLPLRDHVWSKLFSENARRVLKIR
jgi:predicted TIM-barrel fold metal-dependent hydrolase